MTRIRVFSRHVAWVAKVFCSGCLLYKGGVPLLWVYIFCIYYILDGFLGMQTASCCNVIVTFSIRIRNMLYVTLQL